MDTATLNPTEQMGRDGISMLSSSRCLSADQQIHLRMGRV
jgi:hypothetical protein